MTGITYAEMLRAIEPTHNRPRDNEVTLDGVDYYLLGDCNKGEFLRQNLRKYY